MFYELHHYDNTIQNHNQEQQERCKKAAELYLSGFSLEDIEIALQTKEHPDPIIILPPHLYEFLNIFSHKGANTLPPY